MARDETRILSLTRTQRYGIAILGVNLAGLLRAALNPILGADLPLFLFIFPIIAAGWYGGLWPGLLATVLSLLIGDYFFIPPKGSILHYEDLLAESRVLALALTGMLVSILSELTRKAIKARFETLESFAILVDSVPDYAIFTTDPEGRITYWNAGAERMVGYSEREIIGSGLSIFYAPEDAVGGKPGFELETARSTGHCEQEGWQTRKDGSRFWASGVIVAQRNEAGQLRGFAKVIRDMTNISWPTK